jgi:hypothetical protein
MLEQRARTEGERHIIEAQDGRHAAILGVRPGLEGREITSIP